jgi:uncharacterized protein (DUF3820 family)
VDKAQLVEIANTEMPFGKYKGRRLIDVPEEYLLHFGFVNHLDAELLRFRQLRTRRFACNHQIGFLRHGGGEGGRD